MKKVEMFINIIHYVIYKFDNKLHMLSNKLNPFLLLGKIPAIRKRFEEQGTTQLEIVNKVWTDKQSGLGLLISGGGLTIMVFLMLFSSYLLINAIVKNPFNLSWRQGFIVCMFLAYIACHYSVFFNDKYIVYYKQFEKWSKKEKWKYGVLSLVFTVIVFVLFIYSLRFLPNA